MKLLIKQAINYALHLISPVFDEGYFFRDPPHAVCRIPFHRFPECIQPIALLTYEAVTFFYFADKFRNTSADYNGFSLFSIQI